MGMGVHKTCRNRFAGSIEDKIGFVFYVGADFCDFIVLCKQVGKEKTLAVPNSAVFK